MVDLAALLATLEGQQFCLQPPLEGQPPGARYVAVKASAGGLTVRRVEDGLEVWIPDQEVEGYRASIPPAERWDGTLLLIRRCAVDNFGIAFPVPG